MPINQYQCYSNSSPVITSHPFRLRDLGLTNSVGVFDDARLNVIFDLTFARSETLLVLKFSKKNVLSAEFEGIIFATDIQPQYRAKDGIDGRQSHGGARKSWSVWTGPDLFASCCEQLAQPSSSARTWVHHSNLQVVLTIVCPWTETARYYAESTRVSESFCQICNRKLDAPTNLK